MRFSGWIRCLICSAFLFSFHPSEPATGNQTTDQHRLPGSNETELTQCSCIDEKDRKYNLASLAKKGGPRFTVQAKDNYSYSYNPCVSFTLGSFGDCSDGNVAVCRWTNTSYENIGYQGRARCALQWDGTPKLVYPAKRPWLSVVNLQCDRKRKSIQSADFSVIKDDKARPVIFLLKHNCACPNACPDETPTRPFEKSWKTVGVPILVAAGCSLLLCTACIANCRLLISRRNSPQEVTPLIGEEGQDRGSDMSYNTAGAFSQTEATSDNDEDFVTASSTMTSVQDDPISDPTLVLKSVNEISKIHKQGRVGESDCASSLINEAKV